MPTTQSVAEEIKMGRAFRSLSLEGSLGLLRTADVIRRYFDSVVEPQGLTLQQYNVLRILRGAGPDGLPTLEVADRMVERAPGITRMLDRLMAKGLVVRERSTRDRRARSRSPRRRPASSGSRSIPRLGR